MRTRSNLELICGCGQDCCDLMIPALTELDAKTLKLILKSFKHVAKHHLTDAELLEARDEYMGGRSDLRTNS